MNEVDRWLLPDGIEEILPERAQQTETLRRGLVDLFDSWGYDYVIPPLLEFKDSLLTGSGRDIDLLTFKLTDQFSGRTLGLRADITPQVARMDAHSLKRQGVNRLCYSGHVVHTVAKAPLNSRSPLKVGVEMFGVSALEAEIEVLSLLLEALSVAKLEQQYVDIGHVGIYRSLAAVAGLDKNAEKELFSLLQSKAFNDVDSWLQANVTDPAAVGWLSALPRLSGSERVIDDARAAFGGAPASVGEALDDLQTLADIMIARYPQAKFYFDLSELRGYHYHTGIVFGAFAPGVGNAIASGGRYDHIGEAFGRARAATGFTIDVSAVCRLLEIEPTQPQGIFIPADYPAELWGAIQNLRKTGERVVIGVPGQETPHSYQKCNRIAQVRDTELVLSPFGTIKKQQDSDEIGNDG